MHGYLLLWNGEKDSWSGLRRAVRSIRTSGRALVNWACGQRKTFPPDSRVYIKRTGRKGRGIVASGRVVGEVRRLPRWQEGSGTALFVPVELDAIVEDPFSDDLLPQVVLPTGASGTFSWNKQGGGEVIPEDVVTELEVLWRAHLAGKGFHVPAPAKRSSTAFLDRAWQAEHPAPGRGAEREEALRTTAQGTRAFFARYSSVHANRAAAESALAESILAAHELAPASWSVTLFDNLVRLNVGMPYALEFHADGRAVVTVQDGAECRRVLRSFGRRVARTEQVPFKKAPGVVPYACPAELFARLYEAVRTFHRMAIANAAGRQPKTAHRGHSPGVLAYLRERGLAVPPPRARDQLPETVDDLRQSAARLELPDFDPSRLRDERRRVVAEIARRDGQDAFREALLLAYGGRCAISGCAAAGALEAAHIQRYQGRKSNDVRNGLLLRADLHRLFDQGLIRVGGDYVVRVSPELRGQGYDDVDGRRLRPPEDDDLRPHRGALRERLRASRRIRLTTGA